MARLAAALYGRDVRSAAILFVLVGACGGPTEHPAPCPEPAPTPPAVESVHPSVGAPSRIVGDMSSPAGEYHLESASELGGATHQHTFVVSGCEPGEMPLDLELSVSATTWLRCDVGWRQVVAGHELDEHFPDVAFGRITWEVHDDLGDRGQDEWFGRFELVYAHYRIFIRADRVIVQQWAEGDPRIDVMESAVERVTR